MRIFSPKRYVASVDRIDLDTLWADGKRAILLDRDNTLVPRDTEQVPAAVSAWLDTARAKGFKLCMVSNNWHRDQVMSSARELGLEAISHAMKPAPFALKAGLKRLGATADEAVLIGDQLYTDVWSGNFAGVDTILVKPQATQDLWYTQIFRIFERRALRDRPCEESVSLCPSTPNPAATISSLSAFGARANRRSRATSALCSSGVLSIPIVWLCVDVASR